MNNQTKPAAGKVIHEAMRIAGKRVEPEARLDVHHP
jgi:hypothetical protein